MYRVDRQCMKTYKVHFQTLWYLINKIRFSNGEWEEEGKDRAFSLAQIVFLSPAGSGPVLGGGRGAGCGMAAAIHVI